ncbi:hypothetical protein HGRIS_003115 [Hohenbuehelia grisea]|uniref:Uncharacterized protein n=1 Tax=Hohenbuehelia grisea TaxID=104357 RepID=A0ABR3JMI5_9AGAR
MSGFLQQFFCCCLARSKDHKTVPDETTHLIPTIEDPEPDIESADLIDEEEHRERLNNIVRNKENKMVNVNSALPFNLHNQVIHSQHSSSRSASTSTNRYSYGVGYGSTQDFGRERRHSHLSTVQVTPSPPRTPSPSCDRERGRRPSSLTPASSRGDRDGADLNVYTRSPVLGVRLVQQNGQPVPPPETLRGRRGRVDASGKGKEPMASPSDDESQGEGALRLTVDYMDGNHGTSGADPDMTPRPPAVFQPHSTASPGTTSPTSPLPISPAIDFKIEDADDIALSWGD